MVAKYPSEVAQRALAILVANKAALVTAGWLANDPSSIMYGDQNKLPVTPMCCVESGPTDRALGGVPNRVTNDHEFYILYYHGKVQDTQLNKLQAEQGAEAIAALFDTKVQLQLADTDFVIHGFITNINPGYAYKDNGKSLVTAVRLTWNGKTKTILGA
jgi:hypothetical protein